MTLKKISLIKVIVTAFPLGLIVMGIIGLLLYEQRRVDKEVEQPFSTPLNTSRLVGYYTKLNDFMSPRGFTESELTNLIRTTSFIEGSLSGVNTGMIIDKELALKKNGRLWSSFSIDYEGDSSKEEDIEVININYVNGSNKEIALGLAIGETLPGLNLSKSLQICFSPIGPPSILSDWGEPPLDWNDLTRQAESFIQSRLKAEQTK